MATKRLPDSLKEASEIILSNITDDTFIPLFTKSGSTEVMKKIKANVLNNGGGGGSAPSAQPNRVIIIDTALEQNIEGKAYKTFAEAKTYMESINDTYFKVELPAGEFSEQLTCSDNWILHGNNTTITAPMKSNVVVGQYGVVNPSGVFISDCTVSGGFAGYHMETEADFVYLPLYKLNNCRIIEFCSASETADLFISVCEHCEIETTRSHNDMVAKGTPGSFPYLVATIHSTIIQFGASAATLIICLNSVIRNVGAWKVQFFNCVHAPKLFEELPEINAAVIGMDNCVFQNLKSLSTDITIFGIYDSTVSFKMDGEIHIDRFNARNSYVDLETDSTATITIRESWVSPDTVCHVTSHVTWSATTDRTMCYIMYSTDGGQTMSYNSTGATHYGILKYLPSEYSYDTSYYMWFPMPIQS